MGSETADGADASSDRERLRANGNGERLQSRPADKRDRAFLDDVFESTRAEQFALTGSCPERIEALPVQRFSMPDTSYRRHDPRGRFDGVMLGARAGTSSRPASRFALGRAAPMRR